MSRLSISKSYTLVSQPDSLTSPRRNRHFTPKKKSCTPETYAHLSFIRSQNYKRNYFPRKWGGRRWNPIIFHHERPKRLYYLPPKHKVGSYLFAVSWLAHMRGKASYDNKQYGAIWRRASKMPFQPPPSTRWQYWQLPTSAYLQESLICIFDRRVVFFLFYPPFLSFFMKKKKFNVSRCFKNFRVLITETTKFHYILLRPKDIYFLFFPLPLSNPFGFVAKWNCDFPFL